MTANDNSFDKMQSISCAVVFFYFDVGLVKKFHREFVRIAVLVDDARYTRVDNHFRADYARLVGAVERRSVYGDTQLSGLDNSILFGVDGITKLVSSTRFDTQFYAQTLAFLYA